MNNTTNTTGSPTIAQAEQVFKIVFYVVLFIVGTIGNLLVVIIIRNKRRRTVNDCLIFNLATSDLTFLWFALPFYFYELFEKFIKFNFFCKFMWPMMSVSLSVGIFTLAFMSVERCRAILFPFRPRIKKRTLLLAISCIWIASLLCIIPLMIVVSPQGIVCLERWPSESHRKAYTAALFILQFAVPITVIAVAYITIIVKLIKTKVPNRTSVNNRGQLIKQKNRTENIHVIRTVAIIVVLFVACMLPNQIAWILLDFGGDQYKNLSEKFWLFAEALMFLQSCVNPIIYGTLTRQFREGYIKYINIICCCGRSAKKTMDLTEGRHYQDRRSNFSRPLGRLTYKGSLKSPSIIKSTGSTQPATGTSFVAFRTSSPKTSPSASPVQLSPVLLNNNKYPQRLALQNGSSGNMEVCRNNFPTCVPVRYHDLGPGVPHEADDTVLINQGVISAKDNLKHCSTGVKKPNATNESKNGMIETETTQEQMNKGNDTSNKAAEQHSLSSKTNCMTSTTMPLQKVSIVPDNIRNSDTATDQSAGSSLVAGPSAVNYGAMDDEECSLQDTHL